jgi:hypothetical protein
VTDSARLRAALPIVETDRPGLVRCSTLTSAQQSNLQTKLRFAAELEATWPGVSQRRRAIRLAVHESTLRGWLRRDALDRVPPPEAFEKLDRYRQFNALRLEFGGIK